MSFTKIKKPLAGLREALAEIVPEGTSADMQEALLAAGATVKLLETDDQAWVACIAADNPETPFIDYLTVVIAGKAGDVARSSNGLPLSRVFISAIDPAIVADRGSDAIRREQMLMALGEHDGANDPADDEQTQRIKRSRAAGRSIRTLLAVAAQMSAVQRDVL